MIAHNGLKYESTNGWSFCCKWVVLKEGVTGLGKRISAGYSIRAYYRVLYSWMRFSDYFMTKSLCLSSLLIMPYLLVVSTWELGQRLAITRYVTRLLCIKFSSAQPTPAFLKDSRIVRYRYGPHPASAVICDSALNFSARYLSQTFDLNLGLMASGNMSAKNLTTAVFRLISLNELFPSTMCSLPCALYDDCPVITFVFYLERLQTSGDIQSFSVIGFGLNNMNSNFEILSTYSKENDFGILFYNMSQKYLTPLKEIIKNE